jgi:hypothetical protein
LSWTLSKPRLASKCCPVLTCARAPQVSASGANHEPRLVHQYDEEYEEIKKTRRPGRPASAREDLVKLKISALEKEHRDGFCKPPQSCLPT